MNGIAIDSLGQVFGPNQAESGMRQSITGGQRVWPKTARFNRGMLVARLFPEFRTKTEISDLQSLKKPMKVGGFLSQIAHYPYGIGIA